MASRSRPSTRRSNSATPGLRAPILRLYPVPPQVVPEAMRRRVAVTASDDDAPRADARCGGVRLGGCGRTRIPGPRHWRSTSRWRRVSAGPDLPRGASRPRPPPSRPPPGRASRASGPISRPPSDRVRTPGQIERFGEAIQRLSDGVLRVPYRHLAASAGLLAGTVPAYDGVRLGLAIYGIVPDDAGPARRLPGRRRASSVRSCPCTLGRSGSPTFRRARGSATGRRSRLPARAGSRRSRWATATASPRSLSNRAEALVRGRRVPLVGQRRDGRGHGRRHGRARPAGHRRRRVRPARRAGRRGDPGRRAGATAHHEHMGDGHRDGSQAVTGVPCRLGTRGHPHARDGERTVARIEIWNGDICDLEVDAIVNAANASAVDVDRRRRGAQAGRRRRRSSSPRSARLPSRSVTRSSLRPVSWPPGWSSTRSRSIGTGGRVRR